jgi:hypothetical protein
VRLTVSAAENRIRPGAVLQLALRNQATGRRRTTGFRQSTFAPLRLFPASSSRSTSDQAAVRFSFADRGARPCG